MRAGPVRLHDFAFAFGVAGGGGVPPAQALLHLLPQYSNSVSARTMELRRVFSEEETHDILEQVALHKRVAHLAESFP
jgi:hypothetical protein